MCHGIAESQEKPLTVERFDSLMGIAAELGFASVDYDQLAAWRAGEGKLPPRSIMIDFDHPVRSIRYEVREILDRYGFRGNLFVNTEPMDPDDPEGRTQYHDQDCMTWREIGELLEAGWQIGAHTHTHPNLSQLFQEDPTGEKLVAELETCDSLIHQHLGIIPQDFAFTGTSWSSRAEEEVKKRYRFGRLWIVGSRYSVDGQDVRYADLVGVPGPDEADGGPPVAARYITAEADPYRLPSMELQALVHTDEAFRDYLEGAWD